MVDADEVVNSLSCGVCVNKINLSRHLLYVVIASVLKVVGNVWVFLWHGVCPMVAKCYL